MTENYELYLPPITYNPVNGQFRKGNIPFNKGKKWSDYMDMRKAKRMLKCLELGRTKGNGKLAGANKKARVAIKDGKLIAFESATEAAKILKAKGVKISQRNICACCLEQKVTVGKYSYVRKKAGGYVWFYADQTEKYINLLY